MENFIKFAAFFILIQFIWRCSLTAIKKNNMMNFLVVMA